MKVGVKRVHPDAQTPRYQTPGSACLDLHACCADTVYVLPGSCHQFDTGLAFAVPEGHVMLVYSRSGHGFKHGIRLSNSVGVVDSDYRQTVRVALQNDSTRVFAVQPGDRIAQAMVVPVPAVEFDEVLELGATERLGGLGSTGS